MLRQFELVEAQQPTRIRFSAAVPRYLETNLEWDSPPLVRLEDVYGTLCSSFDGTVRLSADGAANLGLFQVRPLM